MREDPFQGKDNQRRRIISEARLQQEEEQQANAEGMNGTRGEQLTTPRPSNADHPATGFIFSLSLSGRTWQSANYRRRCKMN